MKTVKVYWILRQAFCLVLGSLLACDLVFAQQTAPTAQTPEQSLSAEQLNTLVAPIALYPDALLSQVLVASTYPLEIVELGQWLDRNSNLKGSALVDAARQQNWDASIQALVVFPDVVKRLNADIRWTTDLGNAFLAQQADVMNAVQRMRTQAVEAGKLKSNSQQTITNEKQGDRSVIEIQPADPQVIYVPYYDPAYVWGPPLYGYYPAWGYPYYGFGFGFGPGIYIGGFFGGLYWGGWGWGANWYHCSIYHNNYFFNRYGYGGRGYTGNWAHNSYHRQGVGYPNSSLNQRYGSGTPTRGASNYSRFGGQSYTSGQYNAVPRANAAAASNWRHFNESGVTSQGAQRSYRSLSADNGNSGYRASSSYSGDRSVSRIQSSPSYRSSNGYRGSSSYGGNRSVSRFQSSPSYRSSNGYRTSPSYGGSYGGNRSVPSYRSSPSYGSSNGYRTSPSYGGSYGGNRSVSSYRSSPSYGSSGYHSSPSFSGGGSIRSGGSFHGGRGR